MKMLGKTRTKVVQTISIGFEFFGPFKKFLVMEMLGKTSLPKGSTNVD